MGRRAVLTTAAPPLPAGPTGAVPQTSLCSALMNKTVLSLLAAALCASACAPIAPNSPVHSAPLELNLVALNDFHGHLESSKSPYKSVNEPAKKTITAGGIDSLAAALQAYRKEDKDLLFVGAGDL